MSHGPRIKTILILAAIPHGLRLDKEIRSIEEAIRRAAKRDVFEIKIRTAVRTQDIRHALAEEQPQIVHFCGHGLEDGSLLLEDDSGENKPVPAKGLASLFQLHADYVECVLLNVCHSDKQATAISKHVNYAIGMNQPIGDKAAIAFAIGFYDGLGYATSNNLDVFQRAFEEGLVAIQLEHPNEGQIPVLQRKASIDKHIYKNRFPQGRNFQAPPLPAHFVDRPEYSQDLKNLLLKKSLDNRTLAVTAIHGLGSVGKSTITAALAHDEDIQVHFCDGILWATLGQQPDVLSLLSGWVQALGDYNFKPTSTDAATNHLRTLLYDKAVLLVVDDAWDTKHAQAFNVGGSKCQVLVTTREGAIAKVLGASIYSLDVMKPSQAIELLTKKLGRDMIGTECQEAETLAKEVGYLPLALELAAAQIASGTSWAILLQDIQLEIARLKTFDDPEARDMTDEASLKRLSLRASLNLSVQRLPEEERQNFIWLGVLPEDATITHSMTVTLWNLEDERDATDTLEYLQSKALLLPGETLLNGTSTYRLHDLFHDLARNLLTAPEKPKRYGDLPGLGLKLSDAHCQFLERYREKTENGLWHTLPSDGYIYQRLVWHLEKAGKKEEIHKLLQEETPLGRNGWYEACASNGQNAIFVTDIARAWFLAEEMFHEEPSQSIALQCRYALMTASLNSLTANVPVELLQALVKKNVWTPEQGLAYTLQSSNSELKARLLAELVNCLPSNAKELALSKALAVAKEIQDESRRALALSTLADKLPPQLLPEALAAVRAIQDKLSRASALGSLAGKLPEVLPEALAVAREIQDESRRTSALSTLADKLPPQLLPEALAVAREIQDEWSRASVLSALADKLPPQLLPEALATAKEIQNEWSRASTLSALANKLPPQLLPEALAAVRAIQDKLSRASALGSLAHKLPEVLPEALTAAREIPSETRRADILSALVDKLPPQLLPEALAIAREIQDESYRVCALSALADKLPKVLPEALAIARVIASERHRASALSALADKLPPQLLPEALALTKEILSEWHRASALISLADKLPPQLLPEALAIAREIQDRSCRASALSSLADKLSPQLLPETLAIARAIQDEEYCADALGALAEKLPSMLTLALAIARKIPSEWRRASALSSLADKLPQVLPEALDAAREIPSEWRRASALSSLADKLPQVLPEALAAAREIPSEWRRASALSSLAGKLSPELLPEALAIAKEIQGESPRADALSSLAGKLPPELLPEALTIAKEIQGESPRADALSSLADKLPPELLPEALAIAKQFQSEWRRADALSTLADKLPQVLPEALATAREIPSKSRRADALGALADKLPSVLPEALAIAREIQSESPRASALSSLADKLPPELLLEALAIAKEIQDEWSRANALSALANKLTPELLPEALAIAREIQSESPRASALSSLADKLPPELLLEALAITRDIQDEWNRANTLSALADKLLPELLPEALAIARDIQDESPRASVLSSLATKLPSVLPEVLAIARDIPSEEHRAYTLSALADKWPPQLLLEALAITGEIPSEEYRAHTLSALALPLSKIPTTLLFPVWGQTLHELSLRTRQNLLRDIKTLVPVIFALGGQGAIAEASCAISNVARWWQ
ncbi:MULTISPECIES: NB-ARC domain-containing protein [Nostocales]|uniref:NB-ARC domain-containing protein n=2 Tax=Nostocales TaxID=1161 RepID=A0ABW8WNJ1_9CYAN|nr:NB-ARC domain-containing protein [Tolypothrix bouteillei]